MGKPICIYHRADLDGECSGAIVKIARPEVELLGWNYGDEIPWHKFYDREVIMVDLSFQPFKLMENLERSSEKLIWIDHHKSAIEESEKSEIGSSILGLRSVDSAACELVWRLFFESKPTPKAVTLLGQYDSWRWTRLEKDKQEIVLNFQFGMRGQPITSPLSDDALSLWELILIGTDRHEYVDDISMRGASIRTYQKKQNAAKAHGGAFETELDGHQVLALCGAKGSLVFDSIWDDHPNCKAMLGFEWRRGKWHIGLYSDRGLDCGSICKRHGGGGHVGAAGFQCDELPFELR